MYALFCGPPDNTLFFKAKKIEAKAG